jgi:hypothetical protein
VQIKSLLHSRYANHPDNKIHQEGTAPSISVLSAQRLASRLLVVKRKMKESLAKRLLWSYLYDIAVVPQFSRLLAVHSAASSMQGYLTGLEPAITGVTNQRRYRFGFRYHQWIWWGLNPQPLLCKRSVLPLELQTHKIALARESYQSNNAFSQLLKGLRR